MRSASTVPIEFAVRVGSAGRAGQSSVQVIVGQRRQRRLARRGDRRREAAPDLRCQPDRLATVMAGEVGHLEAVEDRQLDGLLGADGQEVSRLIELLDEVDRREVGTSQLREFATEGEPGPDTANQAHLRQRVADVGDGRLREPEPPSQLTRPGRVAGVLGQQVQDGPGPGDRRRQRLAFDHRVIDRPRGVRHRRLPSPAASLLNRVRYLDFGGDVGILASIPPSVQYAGR